MASSRTHRNNEPGTLLRTMDGRIVSWSPAMERRYGIPRDVAIGRDAEQLLGTVFPALITDIERGFEVHGIWRGGILTHRNDGTPMLTISEWHRHDDGTASAHLVAEIHADPREALNDDDGTLTGDLLAVMRTVFIESISAATLYGAAGQHLLAAAPDNVRSRLAEASDGIRRELRRNQAGLELLADFSHDLAGTLRSRPRAGVDDNGLPRSFGILPTRPVRTRGRRAARRC